MNTYPKGFFSIGSFIHDSLRIRELGSVRLIELITFCVKNHSRSGPPLSICASILGDIAKIRFCLCENGDFENPFRACIWAANGILKATLFQEPPCRQGSLQKSPALF